MFKRINWLAMWLLGAVTFGIFEIVMWFRITKQQNEMAERLGEKRVMNYIAVFLLGCVTCGIVPLIWCLLFFKQQKNLAEAKGIDLFPTTNAFVLWILMLVPVFRYYVLCTNHNKLCDVFEE